MDSISRPVSKEGKELFFKDPITFCRDEKGKRRSVSLAGAA
jgi:hypothetical protein